jgi:hypothetical protein
MKSLLLLILLSVIVVACKTPLNKATIYYNKYDDQLLDIIRQYDKLSAHHNFMCGFTDRTFKYFSIEIKTDTVRYVYNSAVRNFQLADSVVQFKIDTAGVRKMAIDMYKIKCLWVGKADFYPQKQKVTIDYLAFGMPIKKNPFNESKYLVVAYPQEKWSDSLKNYLVSRTGIQFLSDKAFFTVSNKFK